MISAKRARDTLMLLLFTETETTSKGTKLSYSALKEAYLEKAQELHPDKNRHKRYEWGEDNASACRLNRSRETEFIELKNAWEEYDKIAKLSKLTNHSATHAEKCTDEASFTLFGVGCSFSDSPTERDYRNEIMEQACRGWFSSGELTTGMLEPCRENSTQTMLNASPLPEKNRNITITEVKEKIMDDKVNCCKSKGLRSNGMKSLVQDLEKFKRK